MQKLLNIITFWLLSIAAFCSCTSDEPYISGIDGTGTIIITAITITIITTTTIVTTTTIIQTNPPTPPVALAADRASALHAMAKVALGRTPDTISAQMTNPGSIVRPAMAARNASCVTVEANTD